MELSKKIRSKLLEILFQFSSEIDEIAKLSNFSLIEVPLFYLIPIKITL